MLPSQSYASLLLALLAVIQAKPQYECPGSCPGACYPQCDQQCCAVGSPNPPPVQDPQQTPLHSSLGPHMVNAHGNALLHRPLSLAEMDKITEKTAVGCEEDKMLLKCKNKFDNLAILSTFYGRDDSVTCFSNVVDSSSKCEQHASYVSKKVQDLCTGENRCKIPVTADFLAKNGEENCPGVRKYLKVIYRCSQHPQIAQVCPNGCNGRCWPLCARSCCSPPPPPPPPVSFPSILLPPAQTPQEPSSMTISQALLSPPPQPPPAPPPPPQPQPTVIQPPPVAMAMAQEPLTALATGTCAAQCNPSCAPQCLPSCCNGIPLGITSPSIALSPVAPVQQQPNYQTNYAPALPPPQTAQSYGCPSACQSSCQLGCPQICCRRDQSPGQALYRSRLPANARAPAALKGGYRSPYAMVSNGNYRSRILSQRRLYNPKVYYPQSNAFPNNAIARSRQYSQYQRYGSHVP